jgi:hypothetical protein
VLGDLPRSLTLGADEEAWEDEDAGEEAPRTGPAKEAAHRGARARN